MPKHPDLNSKNCSIGFWEAFYFWLKLGFISFGGPAGQIAIMHQELVVKRQWISEQRFLHALNYCMMLPGPEAQQLATYIGWLMHRYWGGLVAGGLFILPSLFMLIGLGWTYMAYSQLSLVSSMLYGIKPAVTAIVMLATYRLANRVLKNRFLFALALLAFLGLFLLNTPFPVIVLLAALIGVISAKLFPAYFSRTSANNIRKQNRQAAIIDDMTPTPQHALFSWEKFLKIVLFGLALWTLSIGLLVGQFGWSAPLTQMAWFFSKAALVTFGGAYAVLPYVFQGMVEHFHWLTTQQMMDGLALGETTPGPLVMVLTFVGFVVGWSKAILGENQLFLSGAIAALVITYFTFLPSFIFIFAGGPFIESTQGQLKFSGALTSISAAVVGVMLNLGVFFAWHVLWPQGLSEHVDVLAGLICILAFLAMLRFRMGVISVIFACAGIGSLIHFFKL